MTDIVGKLWGFCHTLRHDGIDYGDYIEQLTYLLFLKMIAEKRAEIPPEYSWSVLREKSGIDLTDHYMKTLRGLGEQRGMLGAIYAGVDILPIEGGGYTLTEVNGIPGWQGLQSATGIDLAELLIDHILKV